MESEGLVVSLERDGTFGSVEYDGDVRGELALIDVTSDEYDNDVEELVKPEPERCLVFLLKELASLEAVLAVPAASSDGEVTSSALVSDSGGRIELKPYVEEEVPSSTKEVEGVVKSTTDVPIVGFGSIEDNADGLTEAVEDKSPAMMLDEAGAGEVRELELSTESIDVGAGGEVDDSSLSVPVLLELF